MRSAVAALLFVLALTAPIGSSRAGLDLGPSILPTGSMELIVVEADGCIYCDIFRRDVLPAYEASEQAKDVPVRFVDVNDIDDEHLKLSAAIDIVPTFLVVNGKQEIGRISGYVGPENFFQSIKYLLASAP